MTHVTFRLTAKNRDQLRNPALGNRVWATFFTFYIWVLQPFFTVHLSKRVQLLRVIYAGRIPSIALK